MVESLTGTQNMTVERKCWHSQLEGSDPGKNVQALFASPSCDMLKEMGSGMLWRGSQCREEEEEEEGGGGALSMSPMCIDNLTFGPRTITGMWSVGILGGVDDHNHAHHLSNRSSFYKAVSNNHKRREHVRWCINLIVRFEIFPYRYPGPPSGTMRNHRYCTYLYHRLVTRGYCFLLGNKSTDSDQQRSARKHRPLAPKPPTVILLYMVLLHTYVVHVSPLAAYPGLWHRR